MDKHYTIDEVNALISEGKLKSMTLEATVIRANGDIEPQGIIAGFHKNIFKNIALWMKIKYDRFHTMRNK